MEFDFQNYSRRLTFDRNMRLFNFNYYLYGFEKYSYGVISQFYRILEDKNSKDKNGSNFQIRLDVYYYILCWDKLKKLFDEMERKTSNFLGKVDPIFFKDFRQIKRRLEQLFSEIPTSIRNEYEHPSLEPHIIGNNKGRVIIYDLALPKKNGDLRIHVGKDEFADVKKEHIERLQSCWADLSDLLFTHFSDKPLDSD